MQILNISKLRNGIGILKKQENITENLTAEENRKEITETMENAAAEKKPARRPARKNTTARKKKTDEAAGKEEKGGKAEKKARAEKKTKSASAETVKVKKSGKNKDGGKDLKQNEHSSKLKIIPLGGLEQIGMNITAFEYEDSIIVVDCGLSFPEDDMYGIDLVIPDITYLKDNIDKVKGFFITHGHEDHIGALPYILKEINVPVYASKFTLSLIESKLIEFNMVSSCSLNEITLKEPLVALDIMFSAKGILIDLDEEWVMLEVEVKKKKVVKMFRIDNISSIKEIL